MRKIKRFDISQKKYITYKRNFMLTMAAVLFLSVSMVPLPRHSAHAVQPTDIDLSSVTVDENVSVNTTIGTLSSSPSNNVHPNPSDYKVIPGFDKNTNLPNQEMRDTYDDWWTLYNNPDEFYQDSPYELFAAGGLTDPDSHGTYSYARAGGYYITGIVDFMRSTGDPAALDALVFWSQQLKTNLQDHDGRGYEFFQYMNQNFNKGYNKPYDPKFEESDTNFLDEQMLAGNIALIAHAMHQNRDYLAAAGVEADFWFDYLANNWTPKWLARTTVNESTPYVPPNSLGLQNAVGWNHPTNPLHDDTHPTFSPLDSDWTPSGVSNNHLFPVRHFGHPYLMSLFQYYAMSEYFNSGTGTVTSDAFPVSDFTQEAQTRHDWWYQQTTLNGDGSRDWWLQMATSNAGLRSDSYSQFVNIYLNALHWDAYGNFANDSDMESYAKAWYNGSSAGNTDVYNPGDINNMRKFSNGSGGNTKFLMRFTSLLGCWDPTGEILALNDAAIASGPLAHKIFGSTKWADGAHYDGKLSCELKELEDSSALNFSGDGYTYSLVSGTGDTDNGSFQLTGTNNATLQITESPDFETQDSYSIRIRSDDGGGLTYDEVFTISVNNINEGDPDNDNDGYLASVDPNDSDPCVPDTTAGTCDADDDGFTNENDAFDNDPTEWLDTDSDGTGNNSDICPADPTDSCIDNVSPDVTIDQAQDQLDPTIALNTSFEVVFDEEIDPGTFGCNDLDTTSSTAPGVTCTNVYLVEDEEEIQPGTQVFIATFLATGAGDVVVTIPSGGVDDGHGNLNTTSSSTDNTVTITSSACVALPHTPIAEGGGDYTDASTSFANLNDGDLSSSSRWSRLGDGSYVDIQLDSGAQTVSYIDIAWPFGNQRTDNFDILTSTDGTNFSPVTGGSSGNYTSSGSTQNFQSFAFTAVSAEYIRIVGHGNSNNFWNSISEIEVYGACNSQADVQISVTDASTSVLEAATGHAYTITALNNGPNTVNDFNITASLNAAVNNLTWGSTTDNGGATTTSFTSGTGAWNGTLPSGGSVDFAITVDVVGSAGQQAEVTAMATLVDNTGNDLYETDETNNTASDTDTAIVNAAGNNAPTNVTLTSASVVENNTIGTLIGTLLTSDPDVSDTHTYSFVAGTGDTDNGSFTIGGAGSDELYIQLATDREATTSYSVRVQTDDGNGGTYAEALTISVVDDNDSTPSVTTLQSFTIPENTPEGAAVGTVLATDVDTAGTLQNWTIASGNTGNAFTINGATGEISVATASALDAGAISSYTLGVQVSDGANTSTAENVTVNVTAVADTTKPVVTIVGDAKVFVGQGDTYTESGATATDDTDGNITGSILTSGVVDTAVAGTYIVYYYVEDAAGNADSESRQVIIVADANNVDNDGIDNTVEDSAPNGGDLNGDGSVDSEQGNVATQPNPENTVDPNAYISLAIETEPAAVVTLFNIVNEAGLAEEDEEYEYPYGLFDFSTSVPTGSTQDFTFYLDREYDTSNMVWRKYLNGTYTDVDNVVFGTAAVGSATVTTATITIQDGGPLDDDGTANGVISDPSGPAVLGETELSDTGAPAAVSIAVGVTLAGLVVVLTSSTRRKPTYVSNRR